MTLEELQKGICHLIRSGQPGDVAPNEYLNKVSESDNLLLIRKIARWWRTVQIQEFSVLTGNYLRSIKMLDTHIDGFLKTENFSSFRNEVGLQFLNYLIKTKPDNMTTMLAELELNLIKQRLGYKVFYSKTWDVEPYELINYLLHNNYDPFIQLSRGKYVVTVSSELKNKVFKIEEI